MATLHAAQAEQAGQKATVVIGANADPVHPQRAAPRQDVDVIADILSIDNRHLFSCKVCDISVTGARIRSDRVGTLPRRFSLSIAAVGLLMPCEIVWCRAGYAGMRFLAAENGAVAG